MKIKKIKIEKLWGYKDIILNLNNDINIILGSNGSGKTTILQIINAIITIDIKQLIEINYSRVSLTFCNDNFKKEEFFITIEKNINNTNNTNNLLFSTNNINIINEYSSKEGQKKFTIEFNYDNIRFNMWPSRIRRTIYKEINLIFLPIDRNIKFHKYFENYRNEKRRSFENEFDTTIDSHIKFLQVNLIKYFSQIQTKLSIELKKFQEYFFQQSIEQRLSQNIFEEIKKYELSTFEKKANEIFQSLEISEDRRKLIKEKINNLNNSNAEIQEVIQNDWKTTFGVDLFLTISTYIDIFKLAEKNDEFKRKKEDIEKQTKKFVSILDNIFKNKSLLINEKNELLFKIEQGKELDLVYLSSGEKQMLILLGECLLQELNPFIFIIDEPELSLHVEWQDLFIYNILQLNPNIQLILATHSPDIISTYSNKIINIK